MIAYLGSPQVPRPVGGTAVTARALVSLPTAAPAIKAVVMPASPAPQVVVPQAVQASASAMAPGAPRIVATVPNTPAAAAPLLPTAGGGSWGIAHSPSSASASTDQSAPTPAQQAASFFPTVAATPSATMSPDASADAAQASAYAPNASPVNVSSSDGATAFVPASVAASADRASDGGSGVPTLAIGLGVAALTVGAAIMLWRKKKR